MSKIVPSLRHQQSLHHFQPPIIYFDDEDQWVDKCRVCGKKGNIITPCGCRMKYHSTCILKTIKKHIHRAISRGQMLQLSNIRCPECKNQIHFVYVQRYKYGCSYLCQKLKQNCCNKYIVLIIVLLLILASCIMVVVFVQSEQSSIANRILLWIFAAFITIDFVFLLVIISLFFSKYFQFRQIILKKVLEHQELLQSGSSVLAGSDEQNQFQELISQNFQIMIEQDD